MPEEEAVLYNRDKVRRPIPEEKAINRAVDMIWVGPPVHLMPGFDLSAGWQTRRRVQTACAASSHVLKLGAAAAACTA